MERNEAHLRIFEEVVQQINQRYDTRSEEEHSHVIEFFEGPIPLFKLLLNHEVKKNPVIVVSFHLELDTTGAIQWFMRLKHLVPNIHLTACYLKDADGTSYVGEDAYILRTYMVEQDILATYIASEASPEDLFAQKISLPKPSPVKTFSDYKKAFIEFNKMEKQEGDLEH